MAVQNCHRHIVRQSVRRSKHPHHATSEVNQAVAVGANLQITFAAGIKEAGAETGAGDFN
jgi:hypothetical protein